ncbi:hypothetical protein M5K25_017571 [Dendrobium thyrsiflorum]|uniref:Uncharacterized protein n=1 Tax=Dendrobium thyrsiflorum TaxID=117978 RepID=A0ABD0UUZ5_DENTH
MESETIQRTLDLILGQLGTVTQQIRDTQGELTDFRRQTGERLDNIERCMGDPDVDHRFVFDDHGRTDILASPFFDVHFGNDETADDYVDRILYRLTLAIEAQIPPGRWYIVNNPPSSSNSATSPATTTQRVACLLVASLSLLATFFC